MTNKCRLTFHFIGLLLLGLLFNACNEPSPEKVLTESQEEDVVTIYDNGQVETQGKILNGEKTGLWISNYESGIRWSENFYKEGKLNGTSLVFYPNGNLRYRGSFRMGEKIGEWTFYTEDGKVDFKTQFDE